MNLSRSQQKGNGLSLAGVRAGALTPCSSPSGQPTVYSDVTGDHGVIPVLPLGKGTKAKVLVLLALLLVMKSFVSDPGVSSATIQQTGTG